MWYVVGGRWGKTGVGFTFALCVLTFDLLLFASGRTCQSPKGKAPIYDLPHTTYGRYFCLLPFAICLLTCPFLRREERVKAQKAKPHIRPTTYHIRMPHIRKAKDSAFKLEPGRSQVV